MDDITISDINKDDITISDINKDDIIGGSNTTWGVLEQSDSDSEEESKPALSDIKFQNPLNNFILSEEKKEEFKKDFTDITYNNNHLDEIVKILITKYDAAPKSRKLSPTKFKIVMQIFSKEKHEDIACINLQNLEKELFEIVANNYNITEILDRYPKEKNGIDYNWFSNNIKEIHVIEKNNKNLKEVKDKSEQKKYKEKDSRKFNKYIEHFIKYYKQAKNFNGLSIYKYNKEYNLIIYLNKQ